jgi:phosphoserine phosphatase
MKRNKTVASLGVALGTISALTAAAAQAANPLPSWNDTAPKQAIIAFVEKVTKAGSPEFVPPGERIAVFGLDGTLWSEQPVYFQLLFALDRVKALAPLHPEWKEKPPFSRLLSTPKEQMVGVTEHELMEIIIAAHAGMTTEEFEKIVKDWLATAKHPKTGRPYTEMVYQPMQELLAYLRANGFKTFIVSAGGAEFMRVFSEKLYGIPPEQVVGSQGKLQYEVRDGKPVLVKLPEVQFVDNKEGKVIGIQTAIGRRPIAAFGNSDDDLPMLQWTAAGSGARFCLLVHHTDAAHEWAYDRESQVGRLDRGLDEAKGKGWTVVSMKDDWKRIFPVEK